MSWYAFFYNQELLFQVGALDREEALNKCSHILPEQFPEFSDVLESGYLVYIGLSS